MAFIHVLLISIVVILVCCPTGAHAFGAGNIPSYAYLEGKAFRHGDIEDILSELLKRAGGGLLSRGSKFGGLDIKRVYFGNWLRDYSQAVDIAGLKKLPIQTILNLCMVLGFLAHGYATNEFEVTEERLGVYLPTEHIDNPKGYGEGEDPRRYHPQLRGPVDPRELEVDPRTGMKNYIANENGNWDTSKALVRRTLERCIHLGRQHAVSGAKQDEYEAYRLLGQALHTLEDFPAHSNFCELSLVSLGHHQVFVHIGDHVKVRAPNGRDVSPLVTGTFGGSDFIHSLLGEAGDHISQASVSDLNKEVENAKVKLNSGQGTGSISALRTIFTQIPGGSGGEMSREMDDMERIRAGPAAGGKRPEDMTPQELHATLWSILSFRDRVVKKIDKTIEKIPGLGPLIEKLMDNIAVFVFTTLEPYIKPLMQVATQGLSSSSAEVIDSHDQYEVFNDPRASDPTHSFLSKDHFNLILNEPAGQLAKIIVIHTVKAVVDAWTNTTIDPRRVADETLQCLFHPDFHDPNSAIQREMTQYMRNWLGSYGHQQHDIINRLGKEAVRNHQNIRLAGAGGGPDVSAHSYGKTSSKPTGSPLGGLIGKMPGVSGFMNDMGLGNALGGGGKRETEPEAPWNQPHSKFGASGVTTASAPPPVSNAYGYGPPSGAPPRGEAASYYGGSSGYAPPPSAPPGQGGYGGHHSAYGAPSVSFPDAHAPPSFPDAHSSKAPKAPKASKVPKKKKVKKQDDDDDSYSEDSDEESSGDEYVPGGKPKKEKKPVKKPVKGTKHRGFEDDYASGAGGAPSFPSVDAPSFPGANPTGPSYPNPGGPPQPGYGSSSGYYDAPPGAPPQFLSGPSGGYGSSPGYGGGYGESGYPPPGPPPPGGGGYGYGPPPGPPPPGPGGYGYGPPPGGPPQPPYGGGSGYPGAGYGGTGGGNW